MKKKVLLLFIVGIIGFNSCKKDELLQSNDKRLINDIEKQLCISCGGGSWDIQAGHSNTEVPKSKLSVPDSVTINNPRIPINPSQRKK